MCSHCASPLLRFLRNGCWPCNSFRMSDTMTCGELADYLTAQPLDRLVILEKDAEGNGYSPLFGAREASYAATSTPPGDIINPHQQPRPPRFVVLRPRHS